MFTTSYKNNFKIQLYFFYNSNLFKKNNFKFQEHLSVFKLKISKINVNQRRYKYYTVESVQNPSMSGNDL